MQPVLFDLDDSAPSASAVSGGRTFLAQNARVFDCLVTSQTLHRLIARAAKTTARKHGSKRSAATPFEAAVKGLILEPSNAERIAQETLAIYAERHPNARDLVKVELADGPDKADPLADILVRFRFDRGRTVTVATNIKRLKPLSRKPEAGSLLSFVRLATEPGYDPAAPPHNRGFDVEKAILEWYTGRRKILDGRDYYLLACRVTNGQLHAVEAWGTLAGINAAGRPVVTRHENRAVIYAARPAGTLPPSMDINRELSGQLLPVTSGAGLRAHLVSVVASRDGHEAARSLAATLLDLEDDELLERVLAAINRD